MVETNAAMKDDTLTWLKAQLSRLDETFVGLGERYDEVDSQLVADYIADVEGHVSIAMHALEEAIAALEREQHMGAKP